MIPYGRQDITRTDIDNVLAALKSDFLTQGPFVPKFERALADNVDAKYAIAVNSATSALHIACLALGLRKDDWVWTSPITFVASANCAIYCGAKIDFVDIDPATYNLSVEALEEKLINAKRNRTLPKIVIPVHMCGQSCDMKRIYALGERYGFSIIEDASHAVGGYYDNHPIGNCQYSDIAIFSFHPVKIITTAEGGMAVTNSLELAESMRSLRSHGITRDTNLMLNEPDGPWYYEQLSLGFNYRMTDLQAALGLSQLKKLNKYVNKRHKIAEKYSKALVNLPITLPAQHSDSYSSYHLYPILVNQNSPINKHDLFVKLKNEGIGVNVHYIPVHLQPFYKKLGFVSGSYPVAEDYYDRTISIPIFYGLKEKQQDYIIEKLTQLLT
tara:strand:+ start:82345 stop:83499 length:1155 start_codon:yes stop_codon:yes gene_type:complete